jgi:hypothetical protein
MFQELTVAATISVVFNAYLYSCVILMGLSYVGYLFIQHAEKSPKPSPYHWFG